MIALQLVSNTYFQKDCVSSLITITINLKHPDTVIVVCSFTRKQFLPSGFAVNLITVIVSFYNILNNLIQLHHFIYFQLIACL